MYEVIIGDATSATFNLTLPTASSNTGKVLTLKKVNSSANAITLVGTIDGSTNYSLSSQNKYVTVISNSAAWFIIANN